MLVDLVCGIITYAGKDDATIHLVRCIKKLEYRGHDSFGCAFYTSKKLIVKKGVGSAEPLIKSYGIKDIRSRVGMFHTRWATNGEVNRKNAHPQVDCTGNVAIVHNGLIENFAELKKSLVGHIFRSSTDTEVIAHLIEKYLKEGMSLIEAAVKTNKILIGYSSFAVMYSNFDGVVAVRGGPPLVLGIGKNGTFISSDVNSLVDEAKEIIYMNNGDVAYTYPEGYKLLGLSTTTQHTHKKVFPHQSDIVLKQKHKYIMLDEIFEQQELVQKIISRDLSQIRKAARIVTLAKMVYIVGSGSSFHAAKFGVEMLLKFGVVSISLQPQNLYRYKDLFSTDDVIIFVSQSGETGDMIKNFEYTSKCKKIGLVNVENSFIGRNVDVLIKLDVGPEIAVAATKSFTFSIIYLGLLAAATKSNLKSMLSDIPKLDSAITSLLSKYSRSKINAIARKLSKMGNIWFLGTGIDYPIALEGALKTEEITYVPSKAFDTYEFKHGPLALVSPNFYCVVIISDEEAIRSEGGISEIKTRKGKIIGISATSKKDFNFFIKVKPAGIFSQVTFCIALQLLAYAIGINKKIPIDNPRNLAKTVTVT